MRLPGAWRQAVLPSTKRIPPPRTGPGRHRPQHRAGQLCHASRMFTLPRCKMLAPSVHLQANCRAPCWSVHGRFGLGMHPAGRGPRNVCSCLPSPPPLPCRPKSVLGRHSLPQYATSAYPSARSRAMGSLNWAPRSGHALLQPGPVRSGRCSTGACPRLAAGCAGRGHRR